MGRKLEDPILYEAFSKRIQQYLEDNKLSNTALANLLGCDEGTIRKYKTGEALPSHTAMKKLSEITGINYYEYMGYKDPTGEDK